ncbi:5,6-dimethylbenzimidazole synthase [Xaviernesmea oryzae]|uniref:5,6-dimethylbenzimidazole synthase n=1 Tax=Xaviernesmea oryzae TaxID=464029 RepID=A0A1Q9B1K3_9HYPH|nr:5,6-dimethylbenzimidazole synthase [Xaviernesmea oryzae]OLP61887.1 5,6-dimethylbenzimidazole synthase [Xaviernesmea oryzae]SEL74358.1 cob(II)yrinic acid a,c-diamide reductase [Xaviernesmea oryzae]
MKTVLAEDLAEASPSHVPFGVQFESGFQDELQALFRWRRDVRRFQRMPLPEGTFEELIAIASQAPSVGLSQPWRFVEVESPLRRAMVRASFARCNAAALASQEGERAALYARLKLEGLNEAPCQFALFVDRAAAQGHGLGRRTMPETVDYSAVIALHTLWLAARARGIGLGWLSILEPESVTAALDVPSSWHFLGYFCLGYPASEDDRPALEREGWERRVDPATMIVRR